MSPTIPVSEYHERIKKFQANIKAEGLDAAIVHGIECDCAHVRYLTEYWPTFESAGVFVPAEGTPILLIGPESEFYARDRSVIPNIMKMVPYRESAEPEYPGIDVAKWADVVKASGVKKLDKLGIVGGAIISMPVIESLRKELPKVELVLAGETLWSLRYVKSENELACMRRAFEIGEIAIEAILNEIKPGMTEFQVIGIAQREIYKNGGEYEGHALYCFSGPRTNNAICRPSSKIIKTNEMIQLNIGARVCGYSSSVGLPFSIGKLPENQRKLQAFGLEAHKKTIDLLGGGRPAADVVNKYEKWVEEQGFKKFMLYGPCHAIGMMEVERPWMESVSTYNLVPNMTFQVDTFFYDTDFGLRWENGVLIKEQGVEELSNKYMKIVEL
ncbi:MAG: Xaa-Pro peptidase family protein [Victivallaceae bacterium]|nr:Xaa-Pro peptidase family protein [Victivallaceae bacterium]MDD4181072.1 Xaa-Pro peptidase family protein [Victivallaceae bacterium]